MVKASGFPDKRLLFPPRLGASVVSINVRFSLDERRGYRGVLCLLHPPHADVALQNVGGLASTLDAAETSRAIVTLASRMAACLVPGAARGVGMSFRSG